MISKLTAVEIKSFTICHISNSFIKNKTKIYSDIESQLKIQLYGYVTCKNWKKSLTITHHYYLLVTMLGSEKYKF